MDPDSQSDDAEARLATRRQSLLAIGRFAAATAPAMMVLLSHGAAQADAGENEGGEAGEGHGFNSHTGRHSNG